MAISRLYKTTLLAVFSLILAVSMQANAQSASPKTLVETTVNAILDILRNDALGQEEARDQMRSEISKAFDPPHHGPECAVHQLASGQ